ncbi:MAG: tetratricopeptide repeat protein [Pseudomonadota bacterium]
MTRDAFDLPVSAATQSQAAAYDAYVLEFLSYGAGIRDYFSAVDNTCDAPLLNAHAAALHLAFEGAEGWHHAAPFLEKMSAAKTPMTERETLFCSAVLAWAEKDFPTTMALLDELTVRWPADLCAIKWGQYHAFNLGDQPALLRFGQRAKVAHEDRPYVHGMIAFALEQNHDLDGAFEEGMHATEIALDDAWAHHAVAHVFETRGDIAKGAKWMARCAHTWSDKGVFIRDHNWWHTALFHLQAGDQQSALGIFDTYLWGEWPEFPQEQIGAISMLWRMEMRGIDVGTRWTPVVEEARKRAGERILPFHDLHYLYALARAGSDEETKTMQQSIAEHAQTASGRTEVAWRDAAVPAADGIVAFARGDYEAATEHLGAAMPELYRVGGSHAQRHLFEEVRQTAALMAGDTAQSA